MELRLAALDMLLPPDAANWSPVLRTSFRLLTAMIVVGVTTALLISALALEQIDLSIRIVIAVACVALISLAVVIRRGTDLRVATHLFLGSVTGTLLAITTLTGGRPTSSVIALVLIPLFALTLAGAHAAVLWGGILLIGIGTIFEFVTDPIVTYTQAELEAQRLGGAIWCVGSVLLFWWVTEAERRLTLSDLVEAKEEFKAQQEELRQVIDLVPQCIFVKDREGRILLANRALAEVYGLTVEQVVGRLHREIHTGAKEVERMLNDDRAVIDSGEPFFNRVESVVVENGKRRLFETTKIPYTVVGSSVPAVMGISADITERTEAERRLRQAEHLASIGTLSAGIAHQINNPVGAIMAAAEYGTIVLDEGGTPAEVRSSFNDIISQTQRCGKIVRDVLSFSRTEHAEKERENVSLIVDRICKLVDSYAQEHEVELQNESSEAELFALVSVIEIEQVIENVLRNGVESGGSRVSVKCDRRADEVIIVIQDDGMGISNKELAKIFDPFFTSRLKEGGSGLGLSVAQGIVKAHGGRIEVQSSSHGSRFSIHLPAVASADT